MDIFGTHFILYTRIDTLQTSVTELYIHITKLWKPCYEFYLSIIHSLQIFQYHLPLNYGNSDPTKRVTHQVTKLLNLSYKYV